jgi:hypothetical protein
MFKDSSYYILDDTKNIPGMREIESINDFVQAEGDGVFFSVNAFEERRKAENLLHINAWYCDIDGNKEEIREKLHLGPLRPSLINETKNGFHLFWLAKDATKENYSEIEKRIIDIYGADPAAKDLTRVLRMPGYFHYKDILNPFMIRTKSYPGYEYTEKEMLEAFPPLRKPIMPKRIKKINTSTNIIDELYHFDCMEGLKILSGTEAVNNEVFSFERNYDGTVQIVCNGNKIGAWIDLNGRIGSHGSAGPSLYQWLLWYHEDTNKIKEIAREYLKLGGQTNGKAENI